MFDVVQIEFSDALHLEQNGRDIGVFEPSSGAFFEFSDFDWRYQGLTKSYDSILKEIGIVGMDQQYTFIWIKSRK